MAGHHNSPSCCGRVFKLNPSAQDFDEDRRCNSRQTPAHDAVDLGLGDLGFKNMKNMCKDDQ